jgi:hypothetical protein
MAFLFLAGGCFGLGGGECRCHGLRRVVDRDTEVGCQIGEAALVALADGAEPPLVVAAVELAEDQRGLGLQVDDVEPENRLPATVGQDEMDIVQLAKMCVFVAAGRDHDGLNLRRDRGQVQCESVLGALFRRCFSQQLHRIGVGRRPVVEEEVLVGPHFVGGVQQEHRDIGVAVARIPPPEGERDRQSRFSEVGQCDVGTFRELTHVASKLGPASDAGSSERSAG